MRRTHFAIVLAMVALWVSVSALATPVDATAVTIEARPLYTTAGAPGDSQYAVALGEFGGVVELLVPRPDLGSGVGVRATGTLLWTGRHVLTAAHVVTDNTGALVAATARVNFDLAGGRVFMEATQFAVHPGWLGEDALTEGNDLAVITLAAPAPAGAQRYAIYRASDEVGQTGRKVGYGRSGNGDDGDILTSGVKRQGENVYDDLTDVFSAVIDFDLPPSGSQLAYDFDNGLEANDAFGIFFANPQLGVPNDNEVAAAPGDSGGPTFINGELAGVTSYSMVLQFGNGDTSDINDLLDSSFGEFAVDTRVSYYADWIDSAVIPEPLTAGALLIALGGTARYLRRRLRAA